MAVVDDGSELKSYLLVFRCYSGARVRPGQRIELRDLPADAGPITVNIQTRYAQFSEDAPLPRELIFEVRCRARSLDEARETALPPVGGIAVVISFVTNAAVQAPRLHLAYDVTPGVSSREFVEALLPDEVGLLPVGRWIDAGSFIEVVSAIIASPEHHRLARALSQYDAALRNWNVGSRVMATEHLYMAAEALTKSIERKRRADLQVSEPEHAKLLQVDTTKSNWKIVFHGFVRREYIFGGDKALYDAARNTSDGFEHGRDDLSRIRATSNEIVGKVFSAIRNSVLELLNISDEKRQNLRAAQPIDVSDWYHEIHGSLVGVVANPEMLAVHGQAYPFIDWRLDMTSLVYKGEELEFSTNSTFTARLADGVEFQPTGYGMSAGMNDPKNVRVGSMVISDDETATTVQPHIIPD